MSDKKTVKDAYIYNNNIKIDDHHSHICFNTRRKDYFSLYASDIGGNAVIVCTVGQYKDYAKMMELNKLNKEAVKPVYTQEMSDNYEVPPIGSCIDIFRNSNGANVARSVLVKYSSEEHCIALVDGDELSLPPSYYHYKPAGTRTDGEKLIDDVAEFIGIISEDVNCSYESGAKALIEKFGIKLK